MSKLFRAHSSNDHVEQEKAVKYNTVLANSVILQNIIDMTDVLFQLKLEGHKIMQEDVQFLSPYLTHQIRRFGSYIIDLGKYPAV